MAVNGLEKLTGRIIDDAEKDAAKILGDAEARSAEIKAAYEQKAREITESYREKTSREVESIINKAKSSLETVCRNVMLSAKAEMTEKAFSRVESELSSTDPEKYTELLIALLSRAFCDEVAAEADSMALYGEDTSPENYQVMLNKTDREKFGRAVIVGAKDQCNGKVNAQTLGKLVLSDNTPEITGGLILKCGDIEINCSVKMLISEVREKLEPEIQKTLFHSKA